MNPAGCLLSRARAAFEAVEQVFDAAFGSAANPLRHLGALGFMLFWWLAISGIYLYAALDTSAEGAYRSIDALSREQRVLGGLLRSLHRYSADAFMVVTLAHLVRELLLGRYAGFRRFSWLTGVPLPLFVFACAIGGFWLSWDQLGQFSALATAEFFDWLPFFASPLSRNFLDATSVSDRLFSLFVFVHLGVPLLLLFGLWFHIQRIARADVFPPRALAVGTSVALLTLALAAPVVSQAPADLAVVPGPLAMDWFLLFVHPLAYATSPGLVWGLSGATFLFLLALPFLPRPAPPAVAQVDPDNCNGCRRCFEDCPYAAITMGPHPNGKAGRQLAIVDADLCASCGICVGACPSSTPFRGGAQLLTGIDMPQLPIDALRRRLEAGLAALKGTDKLVVIGCDHCTKVDKLAGADVTTLSLICSGMLPPSFVEYALRGGASGVLVTGCAEGACAFRLGTRWTEERLAGTREPHLRASVPREKVATAWLPAGDEAALAAALDQFRSTHG
jgi:coenzyme F420-reducing hydrogenase delta subunit/NAD-dependent dihydropyrimidine dehydrogenase PreA subunit